MSGGYYRLPTMMRTFFIFSIIIISVMKSVNSLVGLKQTKPSLFTSSSRFFSLHAKVQNQSGKGFGKPTKNTENNNLEESSLITDRPTLSSSSTSSSDDASTTTTTSSTMNGNVEDIIQNTDMFKKKRQVQQESLDEKIQRLRLEEELLASDPSVGAVPELVANRMLGRIIVFFGIPVFGGLSIFVAAFFASKYYDLTIPPVVIAYATQAPFILGLAGISYAILSSSWDEVRTNTHYLIHIRIHTNYSLLTIFPYLCECTIGGWQQARYQRVQDEFEANSRWICTNQVQRDPQG